VLDFVGVLCSTVFVAILGTATAAVAWTCKVIWTYINKNVKSPSLIQRHKPQTAAAAELCVTDRAGVQPIGRRLSPAHTGL